MPIPSRSIWRISYGIMSSEAVGTLDEGVIIELAAGSNKERAASRA
jgi:hypothetical protein